MKRKVTPLDIIYKYNKAKGFKLKKKEILEYLRKMSFHNLFEYTKFCIKELEMEVPDNLKWLMRVQ